MVDRGFESDSVPFKVVMRIVKLFMNSAAQLEAEIDRECFYTNQF